MKDLNPFPRIGGQKGNSLDINIMFTKYHTKTVFSKISVYKILNQNSAVQD